MVYNVFRWSAIPEKLAEHDAAIAALAAHCKADHPLIKAVKSWKVSFGSDAPRPGRIWVEVFDSLAAFEEHGKEHSPACDAVWAPIYATTVPGTTTTSVWSPNQPDAWFER